VRLYRSHAGLSLLILALVYLALCWVALLSVPQPPSLLMVAAGSWLLAIALSALFTLEIPFPDLSRMKWLQTATKSFGVAILAAFAVVIILARLDITTDMLLVLTAEFLAKIELRVTGRSRWQSFWQMLAASTAGIGVAIAIAPWFLMARAAE